MGPESTTPADQSTQFALSSHPTWSGGLLVGTQSRYAHFSTDAITPFVEKPGRASFISEFINDKKQLQQRY